MEDDDDEEMADYGTDLSDDVDSLSSPLSTQTLTTAVDTRHLGNRIPDSPDFPIFLGNRGNRRFPIPDSAGIGKQGIPDSRFCRERESGSRLAANRKIGDTRLCEYSMHDPGLDVALSPSNADSGLPPLLN